MDSTTKYRIAYGIGAPDKRTKQPHAVLHEDLHVVLNHVVITSNGPRVVNVHATFIAGHNYPVTALDLVPVSGTRLEALFLYLCYPVGNVCYEVRVHRDAVHSIGDFLPPPAYEKVRRTSPRGKSYTKQRGTGA